MRKSRKILKVRIQRCFCFSGYCFCQTMSENETNNVRKLKEAFNELITSIDVREIHWNTELHLRNRVMECCDESTSQLYKLSGSDLDNVKQAYETVGIAKGIKIALHSAGINTESLGEEIMHAKRGHDKRVEDLKDEHRKARQMREDIMSDLRKKRTNCECKQREIQAC